MAIQIELPLTTYYRPTHLDLPTVLLPLLVGAYLIMVYSRLRVPNIVWLGRLKCITRLTKPTWLNLPSPVNCALTECLPHVPASRLTTEKCRCHSRPFDWKGERRYFCRGQTDQLQHIVSEVRSRRHITLVAASSDVKRRPIRAVAGLVWTPATLVSTL